MHYVLQALTGGVKLTMSKEVKSQMMATTAQLVKTLYVKTHSLP